jgi:hypothetical protein
MKSRFGLPTVLLPLLFGGTAPAWAGEAVYDFFYGSDKVAVLTTTGNTAFTFTFLSAPDTGAFINDILLDMGSGKFSNTTAGATTPTYAFNEKGFEGTGMQTKISFPMRNGLDRLTSGERASWTIEGAFDGPARVHVNAFINGDSVKLTTPVPEPETYAMALVALGVLGAFRRLRRSKAD